MATITLRNRQGRPLSAFHSGDLTVKGMFPCSFKSYIVFKTEQEAIDKIIYMRKTVNTAHNINRIGAETVEKMNKFINSLTITYTI